MLALRLPKDIEDRLDALAKRTGRTKSYYARKAIVAFIEDMEDVLDAQEVLAASDGTFVTLEEIKADIAADMTARSTLVPLKQSAA